MFSLNFYEPYGRDEVGVTNVNANSGNIPLLRMS